MPRKPKPAAIVFTYSLSVADGVFGFPTMATVTPTPTEPLAILFSIQGPAGGAGGEVGVDSAGHAMISCGPTPSWSSGGGSGSAEIVAHRNPDDYSQYDIVSDVATFTVSA